MIRHDICIQCKCRDSTKESEKQRPFAHLYCPECYEKKWWFSKFKEESQDWVTVMFDRSIQENARNGKIMDLIKG